MFSIYQKFEERMHLLGWLELRSVLNKADNCYVQNVFPCLVRKCRHSIPSSTQNQTGMLWLQLYDVRYTRTNVVPSEQKISSSVNTRLNVIIVRESFKNSCAHSRITEIV